MDKSTRIMYFLASVALAPFAAFFTLLAFYAADLGVLIQQFILAFLNR